MKRQKRTDTKFREKENRRETPRRKQKRAPVSTTENALEKFRLEIQNGPTFICTCCNRLLNSTSVVKFVYEKYKEQENLIEKCRTNELSADNQEFICITCNKSILKGMLTVLAIANGLDLDEVPQTLRDLNQLETTFISRRIQFMKLLALPRGRQKAVHGCVVNIPIDPSQITSVLPRVPSAETMITVKLKRKLQYKGHCIMQNIRPDLIKDALYMLKNTLHNRLYSDVRINEHWVEQNNEETSQLWQSLPILNKNLKTPQILSIIMILTVMRTKLMTPTNKKWRMREVVSLDSHMIVAYSQKIELLTPISF